MGLLRPNQSQGVDGMLRALPAAGKINPFRARRERRFDEQRATIFRRVRPVPEKLEELSAPGLRGSSIYFSLKRSNLSFIVRLKASSGVNFEIGFIPSAPHPARDSAASRARCVLVED